MLPEGIEGRTLGSQTKYLTTGMSLWGAKWDYWKCEGYSNRLLQWKQQKLVQKKAKTERCPILARNTKFLDEDLVIAFISQIMTIGVGGGNHQLPQTPILCHVQALFIGLQHVIAESQDQTAAATLIDVINSNQMELGINNRKGILKTHDSLSPYKILLIIQTEGFMLILLLTHD
ncbi:hypothetical protein VNO77_14561 [Canavalia gladiata]|uniref:Uncharacterized protein n=1 Tax=Canavalia gladiata TaxID=3824 RepID=A0AAN9LY97_CANGL